MTLSIEAHQEGHHHPYLACPECGINSIVQHGSVYVCLKCGFRRNVSEANKSKPDESVGAIAILVILAAILMIFVTTPSSSPSTNPYPTSPYPSS